MLLKKKWIINTLLFVIALALSTGIHGQQQKPSERSFTVEMNKIKESQATRNAKTRQLQKPSDSTSVSSVKTNDQQVSSSNEAVKTTTTKNTMQSSQSSSPGNVKQPAGTKPSEGPMKQPVRATRRH